MVRRLTTILTFLVAPAACSDMKTYDDVSAVRRTEGAITAESLAGATFTVTTPQGAGGFQEDVRRVVIGAPSKLEALRLAVTTEGSRGQCPQRATRYDIALFDSYMNDVGLVFSTCGEGHVAVKGRSAPAFIDEKAVARLTESKPMTGDGLWAITTVRLYEVDASLPTGWKEIGATSDRKGLRVAAAGDMYVEDLVATIGLDQTIDAKPRPRCKPTHRAGLWRQSREVVHLDFCADAEGDVAAFSLLPEDGDARRAVATGGIEVDERPFLALAKAR